MSELEKLQRAEYRKNRQNIIYVLLAVVLAASIVLAAFSLVFVSLNKETYVLFSENGNAVYHAYLKNNEYYEQEALNGQHAYVSSLIQFMDAEFAFHAQMDTEDATYQYQYRVDTQLVIQDNSSGAPIYNPTETVIGPTTRTHRGSTLSFNIPVQIDYVAFNNKATTFIQQYGLSGVSAHLNVTMYVNVVGLSEKFAQGNAAGQHYVQVKIPLCQPILKPTVKNTIPTETQQILAKSNPHKSVFKVLAIIFGILDGAAIAFTAFYIFTTRDQHIDYERKIQRLLENYKSFIQKINAPFDSTGYQVLHVDTFREMLEIRDTLQIPLLMYENPDQTRSVFMIPTSANLLYVFDIKVDNYDELYAGKEEQ